ncbi:hypothetical protein B0A58_11340 [Flavobacterium branchiophilum NBRC 15030 = ATCC 35035]|uniref:hypothetical protein n=1 Tax=Flavobacterium branchiophilum TaxID=55197 RepID=UPI000B5BA722|nr:hypothetical protein [Flavobacterium branchiophilum]OXA74147.1 hypothetical protein B0A58_11340 [Flavobacterium branchiophilum NBRC 15030 = ATCC 35035]GEM54968.1 hypothetical protein FB1_11890 [Flavobacterium branchiophilum NBRC 15030 = ATCC 35035]
MKAGTAQKLEHNMIFTTVMIKLRRVQGSKTIDLQWSNKKLFKRGVKIIVEELKTDEAKAAYLLQKN